MSVESLVIMLGAVVALGVGMCVVAVIRKDSGCPKEGEDD